MNSRNVDEGLDSGTLLWGFILGLIGGALVALLRTPQIGFLRRSQLAPSVDGQTMREKLERVLTPADPIADSIAEGKAAARRRRAELGLEN